MAENLIPGLRAGGRFVAKAPFNAVVKEDVYYTVTATRTAEDLEALNIDIYSRYFAPVGYNLEAYQGLLRTAKEKKAVFITLHNRHNVPCYVLSTFLESYPLIDGVSYERMCIVADLGPLPPSMKNVLEEAKQHFASWIKAHVGLTNPKVTLGTVPTIGYVSEAQAAAFEANRINSITDNNSDVTQIKLLEDKLADKDAYIAELEQRLIEAQNP